MTEVSPFNEGFIFEKIKHSGNFLNLLYGLPKRCWIYWIYDLTTKLKVIIMVDVI